MDGSATTDQMIDKESYNLENSSSPLIPTKALLLK